MSVFDLFLEAYVRFFTSFLPAIALGAVGFAAATARLPLPQTIKAVGVTAVFIGLWQTLATWATIEGYVMPPPTIAEPPYVLVLMLGGALGLWALARFTKTGRQLTDDLDQRLLMAYQIPRIMGGVFLVGWIAGAIPWEFALPAGLGDIWAGIAGWQALRALERGSPDARRLVMRANVIGLVDFIIAVLTGVITSAGFIHILSLDAPNIINAWPLGLFPSFFVGTFITVHLLSLGALRRSDPATARLA